MSTANEVGAQPKPVVTENPPPQRSLSEHSYSKVAPKEEEEDSGKLGTPQSTSGAMPLSIAESIDNKDEKSSNVKKLNIHDLFQPEDDFDFDVSDSEYPELEKDEEHHSENVENTTRDELITVQKEPETRGDELEKNPEEPEPHSGKVENDELINRQTAQMEQDTEDDELENNRKEKDEEFMSEPVDMELDEELMEINRTIVNEERASEGTNYDSQEIASNSSDAVAFSAVDSASESSDSTPSLNFPVRKGHIAITDELIKEVVLLKEQMLMEKGKKRKLVRDSESSNDEDLQESFSDEAKKKGAMKIKLPSAKKRRIEQKSKNVKKEKEIEGFKGWDRSEVEDLNDITIIPYQCSSPVLSADSFPLWTYNNVTSISFAKLKRGFMFKCLVNGCRFQTLVKDTLKEHLESKHSDHLWHGFCNICAENVGPKQVSISEEFKHLEIHLEIFESAAKNAHCDTSKVSKHSSVFLSPSSLPDKSCVFPTKAAPADHHPKASSSPLIAQKPPTKKVAKSREPSPAIQTPKAMQIKSKSPAVSPFLSIGGSSSVLRPWLPTKLNKNQEQAQIMLQSKEALAATYKCMSSSCSFYTIDRELFLKHLSFHEKFTASDKLNFLTCSYCDFVATKTVNLADHIDNEHVHDQFQCNYCFYRACTVFTVTTHQSLFHKTYPSVIIECELIKPRDTRAHLKKVAKLRAEFVPPIICVFCRGKFFVMQAFKEHMLGHSADKHAKCLKCGEISTSRQLSTGSHLETCHGIGSFHCVYCTFGTNNFDKLNNHIVNNHSSKIPLFCERVWNKNPDGTLKHVSSIESSWFPECF